MIVYILTNTLNKSDRLFSATRSDIYRYDIFFLIKVVNYIQFNCSTVKSILSISINYA